MSRPVACRVKTGNTGYLGESTCFNFNLIVMKKFYQAFSIQLFVLLFMFLVPFASAQTFEVTRTDDPTPDGCNSGTDCSLREAIIAANDVGSGTATIQLTGGQTYTLSRVNSDTSTDSDATTADEESGSLKILNNDAAVRIEVVGSGLATIDADEIDRVFILYPGTDVEIDEIEITGGKPADSSIAGGIMVIRNENLEITNSAVTGNSAGDGNSFGGGMWIEGSTVTITSSTISNNVAGFQGGGLRIIRYNEEDGTINSDVTIENSIITNNDGGQWSGGFHIEHSDVTITESTISNNQSTAFGGGFRISSGNITIDRSTINGNTGGLGGGMDIDGGQVLIINSTISDNEADNFNGAGGIYAGNFSDAVIDVVNTTITNNTSGIIGGVINGTGDAEINFSNSIVAGQNSGDDCSGTMTSNGYNLESGTTCGFTSTGDLQNSDPLLGPLQDNGGSVFTHAITNPLSPAVNNGSNTVYTSEGGDLANDTDANGNDRVYDFGSGGVIDIGSFELQQDAGFDGCPVTNEDKILFVKKDESGTGANWGDALGELRDALALFEDETCTTEDVEEIWVTAGTYLPTDDSGDREASFLMPGVNILGGFEGDETNENQRDVESNVSTLSGDINNDDNLSGNSYHVVTSMDEGSGVLFNFTITGGNADGSDPYDKGGGLYANNGGISMADVIFENNYAAALGGGAYVIETVERIGAQHPAFFNTIFRNNESGEDGAGLALEDAESRLTSVIFENNNAGQYGGGIYNDGSDPVLKNVILKQNYADSEGGGLLNTNSSPELFNVLISENIARINGGGIVNATNASPVLTNVTISGNETELSNGGGIYNRNGAAPSLLNSIVWGNTASGSGNEIWNSSNSSIQIAYSLYGNASGDIVEGDGFTATNSLNTSPTFVDSNNDDFSLQSTSPAINTGDPDTEMSDFKLFGPDEIDLAENPRIYNGNVDIIDIGAYEFQAEPEIPSSCPATDGILFVKKGESGTGAGWDNALGELRDIYSLFDSEDCTTDDVDEVWVAAGTYLPTDNSSDRTASFPIINDVDMFGGFEGVNSETSLEDRDWEANVTILSGDIDDSGGINGNSHHVVTAISNVSETILDGFTITGGNADLVDANDNSVGGGLYVDNGTITIRNSVFNDNFAEISGGGVFIKDSGDQPVFTNVEFSNNSSNFGGGLASENSSPTIIKSTFLVNFAEWGGGARLLGGSPVIDQTTFTGNIGNTSGGGLSLKAGEVAKLVSTSNADSDNEVLITNSKFSGNEVMAENGGGAGIHNDASNLTLRNVLVSGNSSDGFGGGIEFIDTPESLIINSTITGNQSQDFGGGIQIINSSPTVQNSIVWNNNSIEYNFARADNFNIGTGEPVTSYSLIQGCNPGGTWDDFCGTDGGDNLSDEAPLFDTDITPGDAPTADGDFSLTSSSPVINTGYNTLYTDSGGDINNDLDLAEEPRLFDGTTDLIDLGAYEFQGEPDSEEPEFAPFITTWEVEAGDLEITIPTTAGQTYNYDVDWGDGNSDTGQTGDASHTYDSADTYTVKITGMFPQIEFFNADDKDKIISVEQWGDIEWASMRKAFQGATNLVINATDKPDLSNAISMLEIFSGATSVNGGLENWDVSTIESMFGAFDGATSFNGNISGWDVSAATDMIRMFAGAAAFNRDIGGWNISSVTTMESMLSNSGLSTENYDATLIGWAAQTVNNEVDLGSDGLTYCDGADARDVLTGAPNSWTITGDELAEDCGEFRPFITTWKTDNPGVSDNQSIRIPMIGNGYDFNVDWGDGSDEDYNTNPGDDVEHFLEHTYTSAGTYTVKITGDFPRIFFNNGGGVNPNTDGDHNKILTIEQWGDIEWSSMEAAFYGASNLTYNATDAPDLSGVTSLASMFRVPGSSGNSEFNGDIGKWNVSTVTTMEGMFQGADKFNQNIGGWDVSNVTTMENMFLFARAFNQDIGGWDVSNVENMDSMFQDVNTFNQDIGGWNVSSVTNMNSMFSNAHAFNQDISDWDVSSVTTMRGMFNDTRVFNQDIGEWDVSKVTDMSFMFSNTDAFDQDIGDWDVSNVTDMSGMFYGQTEPTPFNQDISQWDVSKVTDMSSMFSRASSFNQDIGGWDVSNVTNMRLMFSRARNFNQNIGDWDVSSVENMDRMFFVNIVFNQDIREWDVSKVTNMYQMFAFTDEFNQDIGGWDVSSVKTMQGMFSNSEAFNQNLGNWVVQNVSSMANMFDNSVLSTQNYDNTLIGWESKAVMDDIELGASGLTYCSGETARQSLIDDHNWTINDNGKASGCESIEGEDQRILVSNADDFIFSGDDFGVSNSNFSIIIESLPGKGDFEYDGVDVEADDQLTINDINDDMLTWTPPSDEYGYNFTSFEFTIVDDNDKESDTPYTLTIDLGTVFTEFSGSEGWRFMSNPSDGDSYDDLFSGITVEIGPPPSQTLYELDQENYEWDPVGSTGDEPGVGTPFIIYVLGDDLPVTVQSGENWEELDGSYSYSGLEYDGDGSSPNPGNYYLLGNPHPIALDFCAFTGDNIATSAYFWDPEANSGNGDYMNLNCAVPEEALIAPFQSFWVRTTDSNPSLEIPMEAYLESTTDGYFKEPSKGSEPLEGFPLISFTVTGEEGLFTNRVQILFSEDAKPGLDRFDAPKLSAEGLAEQWLSFHSLGQDGMQYAFQSLPLDMLNEEKVRIPMDIQTTESGRFTLDWTLPESHLFSGSYYLKDNRTGEVVELREGSTYDFEIDEQDAVQTKQAETTHSLSEVADKLNAQSNTHRMSSEGTPRFELLIAATGIDGLTELGAVPEDFTLAQNYPNPFNPTTVISYQLPVSSQVRLEVYDMLGRNVATLVDGQVSAGRHTVNFDARNLSSGVYLYRLQAGSQIMTRKLTILK